MFTWTKEKNKLNKKKHGFYFSDIVDVFNDPHLLELYDGAHSSIDEERYITLGCFHDNLILFVVTTDMRDGNTQIITAREAVPREQEMYYDHYKKSANSGKN